MSINKVFLFVPNVIGYVRVLLYLSSFLAHSLGYGLSCVLLYSLGFILDEFDGRAAIHFDQSSHFGAALDMVTDRTASAGLCLLLAQLYPAYTLLFILFIALDFSSHYYLIYATAMLGHSSHKDSATWSGNPLLKLYYGNKLFMDVLIGGNEFFYIFLYLLHYVVGFQLSWMGVSIGLWQGATLLCLPMYLLKQATNLAQLQCSAQQIARHDLANSIGK